MKRFWSIASNLSLVLLLVAAVGLGWLLMSGRLDETKMQALRAAWFNDSVSNAGEEEAFETFTEESVPGSSARRLSSRAEGTRSMAVSRQGVQQEGIIRQRQIDVALEQLAQAREDLALERAAFKDMREASSVEPVGRDQVAQFRRSVQLMEAAQAAQAKVWLLSMVEDGRFEDAVATLDAMRERSASRILREFQSAGELALAGQLLEALGRYGTIPDTPPDQEASQRVSLSDGISSEP
ncbi:MAG: hypothetical protein VX527_00615 [Planctomycetota bacterium]|nr:hypothetical protein [Planctomycetota bacterium]